MAINNPNNAPQAKRTQNLDTIDLPSHPASHEQNIGAEMNFGRSGGDHRADAQQRGS